MITHSDALEAVHRFGLDIFVSEPKMLTMDLKRLSLNYSMMLQMNRFFNKS